MADEILFYETDWCWDCRMAKNVLDREKVAYRKINIDSDPEAARFVMDTNGGNRSVPTIVFPDGTILVEPGRDELITHLQSLGFI